MSFERAIILDAEALAAETRDTDLCVITEVRAAEPCLREWGQCWGRGGAGGEEDLLFLLSEKLDE